MEHTDTIYMAITIFSRWMFIKILLFSIACVWFYFIFSQFKNFFNVGLQEYSYSLKVHIIYSFIYIHSLYVLVLFDVTYCNWKSFHVMLFVVAVITWVSLVFSLNCVILSNLGFESRSDVVCCVSDRCQWRNGDLVNFPYFLIS